MEEEEELAANNEPSIKEELEAFQNIITTLEPFTNEKKRKLLEMVLRFYELDSKVISEKAVVTSSYTNESQPSDFSSDRTLSPKEFILEKSPKTDVERVACLAYYLTHYRDTPHFKTLDISKLNTEAAQFKFSNAAKAVDNAMRNGSLVPAGKGNKQLSANGELFVAALPDREAAKEAMQSMRQRRKTKSSSKKSSNNKNE